MKSVTNGSRINRKVIRRLENAPLLKTDTGENITVYGDEDIKITIGNSEIKTNVLEADVMDEFSLCLDIMAI